VTGRAAAIQGGLAALGLLAAHLTWQREPERAPGAATVIDASKNDVATIHYADNNTVVDFQRGHGNGDGCRHRHGRPGPSQRAVRSCQHRQ